MPVIKPSTIYRFWQKVVKTAQPGSCWIWIGAAAKGYGKFKIDDINYQAHVVSWLIHVGPIAKGQLCLHNCPGGDNGLCCNPAHLWLGTHRNNAVDMVSKGRWNGGRKAVGFTDQEIRNIRHDCAALVPKATLMKKYGITAMSLWRIQTRKSYAHVK